MLALTLLPMPGTPHISHCLSPPDLSKKQGPWAEEEAAYGWMDFGRRSAEDSDQHL